MEKKIKLKPYNKEATIKFVINAIEQNVSPVFCLIYVDKDWKGAYKTLTIFNRAIPIAIKMYNEAFYNILTQNN